MKRAGNENQDGIQGDGEVIWAKARKRAFLNHLWDRISRLFRITENNWCQCPVHWLGCRLTSHNTFNSSPIILAIVWSLSSHMSLVQCRYRTFPSSLKVLSDGTSLGEGRYKMRKIQKHKVLEYQNNVFFNGKSLTFEKHSDNDK